MTVTYIGNLSLGVALPGANAVGIAGMAGINAALPNILDQIAALAAFSPLPIDFTAQLALANQMVASIQLSISLGIPVPSIAAQIAAILALITALLNQVIAINANLSIVVSFMNLMAAAGLCVYTYSGAVNAMGGEITTALSGGLPAGGGPGASCNALVLATVTPGTWTAMQSVFKTTP